MSPELIDFLFSRTLLANTVLALIAWIVTIVLTSFCICSNTCCLVPRRMKRIITLVWCIALFIAAGLTAYVIPVANWMIDN
jgi:hypothetical protein